MYTPIFRTVFPLSPATQPIELGNSLCCLGSCFSEHMGQKLQQFKFGVLNNPFGIVFHPLAIIRLLHMALTGEKPDPRRVVARDGGFCHLDFHSTVFADTPEGVLHLANARLSYAAEAIHRANWLVLTWGTAFGYQWQKDKLLVSNCHKLPGSNFQKELSSVAAIREAFGALLPLLPADMQIVLTVSPVRHTRDTLPLNSVSKAVLRLAAHELAEQFPNVSYFPAYELVLDDLRDYRFFAADMLHPSAEAVEYVWERFSEAYLSKQALVFKQHWQPLLSRLSHRPLNAYGQSYKQFLEKLDADLAAIRAVDVSGERAWVAAELAKCF